MMDAKARFSDRVEDYIRYRPSYPREVLQVMLEALSDRSSPTIADVGSGTGILTRLLLEEKLRVFGIEPNDEMRTAAERHLGH